MAHYLLYFNQQWVGDHSEGVVRRSGRAGQSLRPGDGGAGIHVFSGGLEETPPIAHGDPTSGRTVVTDGPYAETKEWLGGFALVDVPDDATAKHLGRTHRRGLRLAARGPQVRGRALSGLRTCPTVDLPWPHDA